MDIDEDKLDSWSKRFRDYGGNHTAFTFPARVTIELTNACNLNCLMCPRRKMEVEEGYMDIGLFTRIVDEVAGHELNTKVVLFFRGESLMHPDFQGMLKYAREKGLWDISLATNAMLLDPDMSDFILNTGLEFISFSIDAASEREYRRQRIGADYSTVISNLEYFLSKKRELGLGKPVTQVSLVETEVTRGEVSPFISYWGGKVDRVRIYKQHSMGDEFGGGVDNADAVTFPARLPCPKVINDMVIYWNGEVAICNHDWDRTDLVGNVKEDSICVVWANGRYDNLRRHHISGDLADERPCDKCDYWKTFYLDTGMFGRLISKA